jgi:hypothetical protein
MKSTSIRLGVILFCASIAPLALGARLSAQGGPRYALVVGNSNYSELPKLRNPENDAKDLADSLASLHFHVERLVNADLAQLEDAVVRLGSQLSTSSDSIGFFFFAGHGIQANGVNYLIPSDAHIASEVFLRSKALSVQEVMDSLQNAKNSLNIVVLDACRDNPFSWSRSSSRGLAVIGSQPSGSIIAYATSVGSVAQDGKGRNGVFTQELLKQIGTPGLDIAEVFKRTAASVQASTGGKQIPAIYSQYFSNIFLAGASMPPSQPVKPASLSTTKGKLLYEDRNCIYVRNADGSGVRRLTSGKEQAVSPSWSPDGQTVLFSVFRRDDRPQIGVPVEFISSIYTMKPDGSGLAQITSEDEDAQSPAFSPDGSRIAFARGGDVAIMLPDGSNIQAIFHDLDLCGGEAISWSKDGSRLAFMGFNNNVGVPEKQSPRDVMAIDADGNNLIKLATIHAQQRGQTAWSPDGSQLVIRYNSGKFYRFLTLRTDAPNAPKEVKSVPDSWFAWYLPQ